MTATPFAGERLARGLSWITVAVVVYGLAAAHLPFLIGEPWSSCAVPNERSCVIAFHVLEVPIVLYQAFFAWYGLRRRLPR